jgi:hypothetical protein
MSFVHASSAPQQMFQFVGFPISKSCLKNIEVTGVVRRCHSSLQHHFSYTFCIEMETDE